MTESHQLYPVDQLVERLKIEEGFSKHCYICPAGAHTIGHGRNVDAAGGLGITEAEAEILLRNDVSRTIEECRRFGWFDDLDPDRQSVVVEMVFVLGITRFTKFRLMIFEIERDPSDFSAAARELLDSKFATQLPARATRLARLMAGNHV